MRARLGFMLAILASMLVLFVGMSARRWAHTNEALVAAEASLIGTAGNAQRVLLLRQQAERVSERPRPSQDVTARLTAILSELGIELSHFGGLRPEGESVVGEAHDGKLLYRRQSVILELRGVSIAELGQFLAGWKASQALWVPSKIDLVHARDGGSRAQYDAKIRLSAIYISNEVATP